MVAFRMKDGTGKIELRYTYEDTDRHGNVRIYVRRPGMKKVRLRKTPGTPEFWKSIATHSRDGLSFRLTSGPCAFPQIRERCVGCASNTTAPLNASASTGAPSTCAG